MSKIRDIIENERPLENSGAVVDTDTSTTAVANTVPIRDPNTAIAGKNQCTAWVNFNGLTTAIRDAYNISSIVRNSAGNYTITFITPMTNANYSIVGMANESADTVDSTINEPAYGGLTVCLGRNSDGTANTYPLTTTDFKVKTLRGSSSGSNGEYHDSLDVTIMVFGGK